MLQIQNMTFAYPNRKNNIHTDLTLNIETSKIYGLLGKNGTGKSTLLYLIAGLLKPQSGSVTMWDKPTCKRTKELLEEIFMVNEEFVLPEIPLNDWVKTFRAFYPNYSEETFRNCLREFEIEGNPNMKSLSMGQKKKVFISFALASGVRLLIMDEPTNGLDIPSKVQFRKVVADYIKDDRTVIISTHQVHDVDMLLDHVIIIDNDKLLLDEPISEIKKKYIFEYRTPGAPSDDAIYQEPTLQGNATIAYRKEGMAETNVNLELLFNAIVSTNLKRQTSNL